VSVLRLSFPARAEYLILGRLTLSGLARTQPIDPDSLSDLKLALTEACSNAMRHGSPDGAGNVELRFELLQGALAVEVRDEGRGFTPQPASGNWSELDEGGLGLAIIHALCEDVRIGPREDGTGSSIRFLKRLRAH
jgi:serine/threonine-protein kinase RsbW